MNGTALLITPSLYASNLCRQTRSSGEQNSRTRTMGSQFELGQAVSYGVFGQFRHGMQVQFIHDFTAVGVTVLVLRSRVSAICLVVKPSEIILRTSRSR